MRIYFLLFSSLAFANICALGQSLNFQDAGMERSFELALDQVAISGPGQRRVLTRVPEARSARELQDRHGKRVAGVDDTTELVLYELEAGRRVGQPRIVTREALFRVAEGANPEKVAAAAGAIAVKPAGHGYWQAEAADSAAALEMTAALKANPAVTYAEPLLARQQFKRYTPNDPLFTDQWHLRNTGQFSGVSGMDVRVTNVWARGIFGNNVHIAIVDDGVQENHPDLSANVVTALSYDINYNDPDPSPDIAGDDHGTACAGVAAARGNNSIGVSGSAPLAKIVGLRLISAGTSDAQEAQAMAWSNSVIEISSNSWGPNDDGQTLEAPGALTRAAFSNACANGRGGKGTLFFWAGGNGLQNNDNSNYDGYANSIYTISITAIDPRGQQSWYAEPGANHVAGASSNGDNNNGQEVGITTVDRTGSAGYSTTDYANDFGGTSSACPLAAGVGALMLEANPNLGWRDVQEILLTTATRNHPTDSGWRQNGAGIWVNHKYGGGLINASNAVATAQNWTNLGPHVSSTLSQSGLSISIPDNNASGITRTFTVTEAMRLEQVVATVSISHARRRNLLIELISPMGTTSTLATVDASITTGSNFSNWPLMSVHHWGESPLGVWTLRVSDRVSGTSGTLTSASLTLYGTAAQLDPDQPPVLSVPAAQTIVMGDSLSLAINATDAVDGDFVTLTASNLPAGSSFGVTNGNGSSAGTFTWANAGPIGDYTIHFRASDKDGAQEKTLSISVTPIPVYVGYTNSATITINDNATASPYPSVISVSASGTIRKVIASIRGLTHTYPADIDIVLVGPDGTKAGLLGNSGGGTDASGLTLIFDDAAASALGSTLTSGTWKPSGSVDTAMSAPAPGLTYPASLASFTGKSANGNWSLYVMDRAGQDLGSINNGWSLLLELEGETNQPPAGPTYGMRDDGGVNLPTITYWHDGLGADATQQGAAFAQNFGERTNFFIKGAAIKTWKNGGDVTGTSFKYKIWNAAGAEPGSYTTRAIGFTSNDGDSNQTWAAFGSEINLLTGLAPANYNLKILFDVSGTGEPGILTNGPFTASLAIPETPVVIPAAPAVIRVSETNATSVVAAWSPVSGADDYRLDVATHPEFEGREEGLTLIDEDFVSIPDWTGANTFINAGNFGAAEPSIRLRSGATLDSPAVDYPTQLVFFVDADNNDSGRSSTTYYSLNDGASWSAIDTFNVSSAGITVTQPLPGLANTTNVRFRFVSSFSSWYVDDVKVTGRGPAGAKYLPGYSNLVVSGTSQSVTGLVLGATYYLRVRAVNTAGISSNSPVASVTTLEQLPDEPPLFTPVASQVATAGVTKVFSVFATGRPDPVITLAASTATSEFSFNQLTGALTYTPAFADVGARSFTFVASNSVGVTTQIVSVTVVPVAPAPPAAIWANNIGSSDFVVEWSAVDGAESYRLDVSSLAEFSGGISQSSTLHSNNFNAWGTTWTDGWSHNSGVIYASNGIGGSRAIGLNAANDWIQAPAVVDPSAVSFYARTSSDPGSWTVAIQTSADQATWTTRATLVENGTGGDSDNTYRPVNVPLNLTGTTYIRWFMTARSADSCYLDEVVITGGGSSGPSFIPGFSNRTVSASSELVTGLEPESNYYFRVRAVNAQGASSDSPTGNATTLPGDPVAPVFVPVAPQTAYVGRVLSLFVDASGIPDPEIALSGTTATSGFSFTPDTGRLSYQAPAGDLGSRTFTFVAANSAGSVTQTVSIFVTNAPPEAPVIASIPPQSMMLGSTLNYIVTATDADGTAFTFAVTSTVSSARWTLNTNSGAFAFTPASSQTGTNVFVFRATDSTGLTSAPVTMTVVVSDQADVVAVSLGAARMVAEEGIATVHLPVNLAFAGTAAVQFRFIGPSSGTARRGIDFNCQTQLLVTGSSSGSLILNIVDDDLVEGPESIIVQMIPVPPATAGSVTQAVLYIRDNDSVSVLAGNITSGNNQQYESPGTRILQALAPDVALLQEFETTNGTSSTAYRAWVNDAFGTNYHYVVESGDNIPNGIVSRWPIKAWGEWEDTQVGDRDFVWATIDIPGTQDLHAVSVHFKASSGGDNVAKRNAQARIVTNNIAQKGWLSDGFLVVGGDFNLQVRSEEALRILTNVVSDLRQSADQVGNRNTNSGRDKPYDLVLPGYRLDARHRSFASWGYTYNNGMIFDSRITWANGLPPPALAGDSADVNMQHMAAMKVFELEITTTTFMQDQVITFPAIVGQIATNTLELTATAGSGLPVTYAVRSGPATLISGNRLTFSGAGTVAVAALQAGDSQWNPAPAVTNTFVVAKAGQTITFPVIEDQAETNRVELFAAASSGLDVQFTIAEGPAAMDSGDILTFSGGGLVHVVAGQPGNAIWLAAPAVTNAFMVARSVITNAPVDVPSDWLADNFPGADAGQYEAIVTNLAANGVMSVWESYVAGLDPNDAGSVFMIDPKSMPPAASQDPDAFVLRWPSASNRIYQLGWKTNLLEPFLWTNVIATPPVNTHTATPPAESIFYRIGVSLDL